LRASGEDESVQTQFVLRLLECIAIIQPNRQVWLKPLSAHYGVKLVQPQLTLQVVKLRTQHILLHLAHAVARQFINQ